MIAWIAGTEIGVPEDELVGAVRRAMLLLAAGGDPGRPLELDGRAVTGLAAELDRPERRAALAVRLKELQADAAGLPGVEAALASLLADADLAWRAYAAGLIGAELADDED